MVRTKMRSTIMVADGAGGMMKLEDRRFQQGDWPIRFKVPIEQEQAEHWRRYLTWECHRRGWSDSGLGQLERAENSGTISINAPGKQPHIHVVWERKRGGEIKVRARPAVEFEL